MYRIRKAIRRRSSIALSAQVEMLEQRLVLDASGLDAFGVAGFDSGEDHDAETPEFAAFQFSDTNRWSSNTTGSGYTQGDPIVLTWSIVPDGTSIYGYNGEATSPSNLQSRLNSVYGSPDVWLPLFEQALGRWGELSGITYVYEPNDDGSAWTSSSIASGIAGVRGDVRISGHNIDGGSGILAYNFYPNFGDMVIDTSEFNSGGLFTNTSSNSLILRNVLTHEAGHGVGIAHVDSGNANFLMEPYLSTAFDGPQFDDILAVQRGYGDGFEDGSGNNTAANATGLGTFAGNLQIGMDANDTGVAPSETDFVSIDDDSDVDYFRFDVTTSGTIQIDLTPVGPTYNQGPQGGTQTTFNASMQSNLALALFASDGVTQLGYSDAGGLGSSESILSGLDPGTYYVRVSGADNRAQMYHLEINSSTAPPPPPPTAPSVSLISSASGTEADVFKRGKNAGTPQTSVISFQVSLSSVAATDITLSYHTEDATTGDLATANVDYVSVPNGTVTIPQGSLSATITITIIGDTITEPDEVFQLVLDQIVSGNATLGNALSTGTILDNDTGGGGNGGGKGNGKGKSGKFTSGQDVRPSMASVSLGLPLSSFPSSPTADASQETLPWAYKVDDMHSESVERTDHAEETSQPKLKSESVTVSQTDRSETPTDRLFSQFLSDLALDLSDL